MTMFTINCNDDKIWNIVNLVEFLAANQHKEIVLDINPEAVCLTNLGLYNLLDKFEFDKVTIKTWNPLEQHSRYNILFKGSNFWFWQAPRIDPVFHDWDLSKRFLIFYHRPTAGRLALASHLHFKHDQTSLIHFSADINPSTVVAMDKLLQWDCASAALAGQILPKLPLLLGSTEKYISFSGGLGYDYTDPLTNLYQNILIDVVVETHVAGRTFFPTEKTVRPMLLKKPFVVFASQYYMAYLRQMGFRTFNNIWNEEYDVYSGRERLLKIKILLDDLAQKPIKELKKMHRDMKHILDYNYKLLRSRGYHQNITEIQ